ncbi:hypothetical protein BHU72_09270 [Desulfuribacillus stibiiarsenatis]|uniref:Uncharacterized protein n=1 Tax=Desulfuribacillus stibiiarsenatis TaxID=1390249 RepID=A0A1E5L388_9FIRM|nr:molecular chaperone TorD family protein [Desulfuribacillus stibiiarsenatis]OEH84399.1 hypothetical protein BHU72_09270 [Desulfuribacillus stibiiarsenatis]
MDKKMRSNAYSLLSELIKPPTKRFFQDLTHGALEVEMEILSKGIGYTFEKNSLSEQQFLNFDDYHAQYTKVFNNVASEQISCAPIESLYKPWTQDPTAGVSWAKEKGFLYGDPALHIESIYNALKLTIPTGYEKKPDHLGLMLELAAILVDVTDEEYQLQFMKDHFDWLEEYIKVLESKSKHTFFINCIEIIQKFITWDMNRMERNLKVS